MTTECETKPLYHSYTNKRGETFTITDCYNGGIVITKHPGAEVIFKCNRGWSVDQAKKWCEI
jgi:hypothetical protein